MFDAWLSAILRSSETRRKESYDGTIPQAARELGIESKIHVLEDDQPTRLVTVIEGTRAVQGRNYHRWFLDASFRDLKTILSDLHRMVS